VGTGNDLSIRDLAGAIRDIVGFDGKIVFDTSRPDVTPRKVVLDEEHDVGLPLPPRSVPSVPVGGGRHRPTSRDQLTDGLLLQTTHDRRPDQHLGAQPPGCSIRYETRLTQLLPAAASMML
jgi:hypothetical protein